jgi:hypothetical protein
MGDGRHVTPLIAAGFLVFGVDVDVERLRRAKRAAMEAGAPMHAWASDLTVTAPPAQRFDLVLCVRYLDRARWATLAEAVRPGGFLIYETFTTAQLARESGPRSPEHLLHPGELRQLAAGWDVQVYKEPSSVAATAGLLARRPRRWTPVIL